MAQRVGRCIALLFHDRGTRRGLSGQQYAPAALYPRERTGTHFTVHVLTKVKDDQEKERFYENLEEICNRIPRHDMVIIMRL